MIMHTAGGCPARHPGQEREALSLSQCLAYEEGLEIRVCGIGFHPARRIAVEKHLAADRRSPSLIVSQLPRHAQQLGL